MISFLPPLTALREPHLAAFGPALDPATFTADGQALFDAFAKSPYYEDRFAVWSMRTASALKQKRASSRSCAEEALLARIERDRCAATTAVAMRMVQALSEPKAG